MCVIRKENTQIYTTWPGHWFPLFNVKVLFMFHICSMSQAFVVLSGDIPFQGREREWERRSARLIKRPGTVESESGQAMPLTLSTFGLDNSTGFTQLIDWGGCWVTAAVDYKGFWLPEWLASGIIICMFNYKVNYWPYGEMCVTCCVVLVIMLSSSAVSFWLEWLAMATHNGLLHCTPNARKGATRRVDRYIYCTFTCPSDLRTCKSIWIAVGGG